MMDLASTIVSRVGELEQTDPLDLPPLAETIDVEALDQTLDSVDGPYSIQFTYCGYTVTFTGEDDVSVCAVTEGGLADPSHPQQERTRS